MRLLGTALSLLFCLTVAPSALSARDEVKVSMEDLLKELGSMRRELRELKIQRERDQRVIEDLRRIVEDGVIPQTQEGPRPTASATQTAAPAPEEHPAKAEVDLDKAFPPPPLGKVDPGYGLRIKLPKLSSPALQPVRTSVVAP